MYVTHGKTLVVATVVLFILSSLGVVLPAYGQRGEERDRRFLAPTLDADDDVQKQRGGLYDHDKDKQRAREKGYAYPEDDGKEKRRAPQLPYDNDKELGADGKVKGRQGLPAFDEEKELGADGKPKGRKPFDYPPGIIGDEGGELDADGKVKTRSSRVTGGDDFGDGVELDADGKPKRRGPPNRPPGGSDDEGVELDADGRPKRPGFFARLRGIGSDDDEGPELDAEGNVKTESNRVTNTGESVEGERELDADGNEKEPGFFTRLFGGDEDSESNLGGDSEVLGTSEEVTTEEDEGFLGRLFRFFGG